MKGTFISSDYIKARDNSIRFLEVNTDTVVYDEILDVEFNWQPVLDFISGSYDTLHIISKPELHYKSVENLKDKVAAQLPLLIVSESTSGLNDQFPPTVTDASNKFILRMAYDGNAVLDSEYAANNYNALQLMHEYNHASSCIPFYGVEDGTTINTLNSASYSANVPNAVVKYKWAPRNDVSFHQVTNWSDFQTNLTSSCYAQSFEVSDEVIADGKIWSYRNYSVIYDSDLKSIDLGTATRYAEFSIPSTAQVDIQNLSSNTELPVKHYHEFSTSNLKAQLRKEGLFISEMFTSASGVDIEIDDVVVGQVIKSFHVPGIPDSDDAELYMNYEITGSSWPAGSEMTGSVVQAAVTSYANQEGVVVGLKFSGSDERYYLGPTTSVLAYHSGSDNIKFRPVNSLDEDDVFLIDTSGNLTDIVSNEFIVFNEPFGSYNSVDLEPTDNIVIGDQPFFFAYHNPKPSDLNLKKDVKLVGKSGKGINIYTWRFKNPSKFGFGTYQGVIAQEVPFASVNDPEGFLRVDYSKLDVEHKRIK